MLYHPNEDAGRGIEKVKMGMNVPRGSLDPGTMAQHMVSSGQKYVRKIKTKKLGNQFGFQDGNILTTSFMKSIFSSPT